MGEPEFNPYHKWFGIPPAEQPPNHYRLLGIELFESDTEVIESAADQRLRHLQKHSTGKESELAQKLAREVSTARFCLLKPEIKASYDESLGKTGGQKSASGTSNPSAQRPGPPPVPSSTRSMCSDPPKKASAVPPKMPDTASPKYADDDSPRQPGVSRDSDSRETPTAPPIQDDQPESVQGRSLKTPIVVLALVVIILAGSVFAVKQFGQKDDSDTNQVASNSVDSNDKANDKSSSDRSPPLKNSPAKSTGSDSENNSTDVKKQNDVPQKTTATSKSESGKDSVPTKTEDNQDKNKSKNNGEADSDPSGTAPKFDSSKTEPKKDDGKKKNPQEPAEKDKPLIIKTKDNSKKAIFVPFPFEFEFCRSDVDDDDDNNNWSPDGLHFSPRGYQRLGESLRDPVLELFT